MAKKEKNLETNVEKEDVRETLTVILDTFVKIIDYNELDLMLRF